MRHFYRIDGQVEGKKRQAMIDRFNRDQNKEARVGQRDQGMRAADSCG